VGSRQVEALKDQFLREGYVEFRVRPVKAVLQLLFYVWFIPVVVLIGFAFGPAGLLVSGLLGAFLLTAVAAGPAEQLLGAGPALRVDRTGLTIRRWKAPMVVPWSSGVWIDEFRPNGVGVFRQVRLHVPPGIWDQHREAHPALGAWFSRMQRTNGIPLIKVLDVSARDILAFLGAEVLDTLGIEAEGQQMLREMRDQPYTPPSAELEAFKDAILDLSARQDAADKAAQKAGRVLDPAEEEAFKAEFIALTERYEAATTEEDRGAGDVQR